jgi:hypothetical protein
MMYVFKYGWCPLLRKNIKAKTQSINKSISLVKTPCETKNMECTQQNTREFTVHRDYCMPFYTNSFNMRQHAS